MKLKDARELIAIVDYDMSKELGDAEASYLASFIACQVFEIFGIDEGFKNETFDEEA